MVDYRPIPDERELFHDYRSYAFRPEEGVPAYDPDEHEDPRDTLGSRRGLYVDDGSDPDPRCVCRHYWLESRVRGERHRTAGIASVATPPEYRRNGHVAELLAESLAEYRDRDVRFSVLWPFQYRFYRHYGWDTANSVLIHECAPDVLSFSEGRTDGDDGTLSRCVPGDYDRLEAAYQAHLEQYALSLERDETWWRHRVFGGHSRDSFVYAYERDGRFEGYLVYSIDGDLGDRTMAVDELVFTDLEAIRALLSFCRDHDSQVERIRLRLPKNVPLRAIARNPDEIETTLADGPMVRVVDVVATLSALSYPVCESHLTLRVEDPMSDWNDGLFTLSVEKGLAKCSRNAERTESDENADDDPDISLDIGALSQLVVGTHSVTTLKRMGRLEASEGASVDTLSMLFPESGVYLGDRF